MNNSKSITLTKETFEFDYSMIPPSKKQIKYCYDILKRIGKCPCAEDGTPLFVISMQDAKNFIREHRDNPFGIKKRNESKITTEKKKTKGITRR